MAVNPLLVFVGLSVTTVGGIVAVVQHSKSPPKPIPVVEQPIAVSKPVAKTAVTPAPPSPLSDLTVKKEPVKKLANLPPKQEAPKQKLIDKAPLAAKDSKPASKPIVAPVPVAPSFDMVRVEKDGGAVVVGKAAPRAKLVLKLNNKIIGKTTANEKGDWVFVPEQLVPQGSNELVVETTGASKTPVRSKQTIFIAMPKKAKEKPLIVVAKPDAPTRVLQKPEAKPEPLKLAAAKPVKAPVAKVAAKTAVKLQAPKTVSPKTVAKKTVAPVKSQPVKSQPVKTRPVKKLASLPKPVIKVAPPKPVVEVAPPKPVVKKVKVAPQPNPVKAPRRVRLAFGTVDYNDNGEIVFTGKAIAGSTVRIYVDNLFVGDAIAKTNDEWVFRGNKKVKPGVHRLRADQINSAGKVAQRIGVPFVRANPKKVATLLNTRKNSAKKIERPSKTKSVAVSASTVKTPVAAAPKASEGIVANLADKAVAKPVEKPIVQPSASAQVAKVKTVSQPPEKTVAPVAPKPAGLPVPVAAVSNPVSKKLSKEASPDAKKDETKLVSHVVIQPGNNLWNISRVIYGKGVAYTTIYQANQDQIKDPDRIYPGQIFTTPGTTSTGSIRPDQREPLKQVSADKTVQN